MRAGSVWLAVLLVFAACAEEPSGVASYDGGEISFEAIEGARFAVEMADTSSAEQQALRQYETVAGWLAVARALPEPAGSVATAFRARRAELLVEHYAAEVGLAPPALGDERIEHAVAELRRAFDLQSKRYVHHIFRRSPAGGAQAADAKAALIGLGQRIRTGESIAKLAAQHSDSESRAYGGELGWIERGQLDPPAERVVWLLADGEPSAPVRVHGGWSLFLVERRFEGAELDDPQVYSLAATRERLSSAAESMNATLIESPAETEEIGDERQGGEPEDLLDASTLGQRFGELFRDTTLETPGAWQAFVAQQRATWRLAERIEAAGWLESEAAAGWRERLERGALAQWVEAALRTRAEDRVGAESPAVERYFEDNRGRYRTGLRLRVRLFRLPAAPAVIDQMDELADAVDRGLGLDELGARFGVEVVDLGWLDGAAMADWEAKARQLLIRTQAPGLTVPFTSGGFVSVAEVAERQEPIPLGFEAVKERVRRDYLDTRRAELLAAESERALREIGFSFNPEAARRRLLLITGEPSESAQ